MADLEKPAADTQQEENAVAMTEVGGTDPPVGPAIVPDRDHEAVEPEHGNLEQAAEKKTGYESVADGTVPEDVQQINEVAFDPEQPVVGQDDLVEQAAAMDADESGQVSQDTKDVDSTETETKPEASEQPNVDQASDALPATEDKADVDAEAVNQIEEVKEDKEGEKMDVAEHEQTTAPGEDEKPAETVTGDVNADAANDSGLDDLFGSDDEGEKTTSSYPFPP